MIPLQILSVECTERRSFRFNPRGASSLILTGPSSRRSIWSRLRQDGSVLRIRRKSCHEQGGGICDHD